MCSGFCFPKLIFLFKSSTERVELIWHNCMHPLYRCLYLRLLPWLPFIVDTGASRGQLIFLSSEVYFRRDELHFGRVWFSCWWERQSGVTGSNAAISTAHNVRRGVVKNGLYWDLQLHVMLFFWISLAWEWLSGIWEKEGWAFLPKSSKDFINMDKQYFLWIFSNLCDGDHKGTHYP